MPSIAKAALVLAGLLPLGACSSTVNVVAGGHPNPPIPQDLIMLCSTYGVPDHNFFAYCSPARGTERTTVVRAKG
jgi:hypothetical protein